MLIISHRGNINGEAKEENNPLLLDKVLKTGYNIEIDVWKTSKGIFLGHDMPQYQVTKNFIDNNKFWCHAKNLQALEFMLDNNIHCFWHQKDDFTITSQGFIWTYPGKPVCKNSIIVCQTPAETQYYSNLKIAGICSDYVGMIK